MKTILSEITLGSYKQGHPDQAINPDTWCIPELYWSFLKKKSYITGKIGKCNIEISHDWKGEQNEFNGSTVTKGIKLNFDYEEYFKQDKFSKKKMQLEILHKGMLMIAEKEGWETKSLTEAYEFCLKNNLEYKFFVKDKFTMSPDKKHRIGFFCNWDLDKFEVFWVLFDGNKNEIKRKLLIEKEPHWGEFIYYVTWKWLDNQTVLLEDKYKYGNNEKWEFSI